ncbi:MAG: hypothetical protein Q8P51_12340, partial [Ignavibacteria bacterium]|nr:hypothetical protein [Ignavibacteria bacterium]
MSFKHKVYNDYRRILVGESRPGFSVSCARQGALARECKTPMTPAGGIMSRTARVSTARWNLKEAEGEAL